MSSTSTFPQRWFIFYQLFWLDSLKQFVLSIILFLHGCITFSLFACRCLQAPQLTWKECDTIFCITQHLCKKLQWLILGFVECTRGKCTVAEGSQSGVGSGDARRWCHCISLSFLIVFLFVCLFVFPIRLACVVVDVVQQWNGENRLDHSQRCDLILITSFPCIDLRTVHWHGVVDAMRVNLGHICTLAVTMLSQSFVL